MDNYGGTNEYEMPISMDPNSQLYAQTLDDPDEGLYGAPVSNTIAVGVNKS